MLIGIPYTVNFTDSKLPGKAPFQVNPKTTDGPLRPNVASPDSSATEFHTSIVIPGMGLVQYGERIAETLVHILENFASCDAPVAPTIGQTWYDYCAPGLKVYDGAKWTFVGSAGFEVASTDEYNQLATKINKVAGVPNPASFADAANGYGYNQTPLPILARPALEADWVKLVQMTRNVGQHQGSDMSSLVDTGFSLQSSSAVSYGAITLIRRFNDLETKVNALDTNRKLVNATSLETLVTNAGTSIRSTQWNTSINHIVDLKFSSLAHMYGFFNAGGSINLTAFLDNNSTIANAKWVTLLAKLGTVRLKASTTTATAPTAGIGFYNLTSTLKDLVILASGSLYYNPITYKARAKVNLTTFTVTIDILLTDDVTTDIMTGNLTSAVVVTKPSELFLGTPEMAYPTFTTIRTLAM